MSLSFLRRKLPALVFLCLAVAIAAAVQGCDDKKPTYPTAPVSGLVHFQNFSSKTISIFRFRVAGPTADIWSANAFGQPLLPGYEAWYHLPPGTFDIRLETADYFYIWTRNDVEIEANSEYLYEITD